MDLGTAPRGQAQQGERTSEETDPSQSGPATNPGGGKKALFFGATVKCQECHDSPGKRAVSFPEKAGVDGPATVGGLGGYWTADGGCDKATISASFAEKLAKEGVEIVDYKC